MECLRLGEVALPEHLRRRCLGQPATDEALLVDLGMFGVCVSACLISRTVPSMGTVRRSGVSGALALDGDLIRSSTVGMAGPGCACACKLGDACRLVSWQEKR